jgi:hypothetical protein
VDAYASHAAPKWVPRLCHAVSFDPGTVAELGVRPEASQEGGKRAERTPRTPRKSHLDDDFAACYDDSPVTLSPSVIGHTALGSTNTCCATGSGSSTEPLAP